MLDSQITKMEDFKDFVGLDQAFYFTSYYKNQC